MTQVSTQEFLFDLPDMLQVDFTEHNKESAALWEAFDNRAHKRIPIRLNTNPRMLMLDSRYNTRGVTYEKYMRDPGIMAEAQLEWQYWVRFLLPGDHQKGLPETWEVGIDFGNHYDAAWFGCPVAYRKWQVPDHQPILTDDNKRMLFDRGIPHPFSGEWAERELQFREFFEKKSGAGWAFLGKPVRPAKGSPFAGCDGPFTIVTCLRGSTSLCMDLAGDPEYAHELLDYVVTAVISRMKAWRNRLGLPIKHDNFIFGDDSVELISTDMYREFVLPIHRRLYDEFATDKNRGIHLCGDAQRHFVTLRDELGIMAFDTGFPIDFTALRRGLGRDVLISGGPHISFFLRNESEPVVKEVERILASGILEGGRFILQEGNNLPPTARLHVCGDFYEAGKKLGRLRN